MAAYTAVVAAMGLPLLSLVVMGEASPWKNVQQAFDLFSYVLYGAVFSTWISAFISSREG